MNNWPRVYSLQDPALASHWNAYNGSVTWITCDGQASYMRAFFDCPPLAAVILKKANAFVAGKFEVLNPNTGKYVRGQYKEYEQWLEHPNPVQSKTQFLKQLYAYTYINGWCYVLKIRPVGLKDAPPVMWILPPQFVEVEKVDSFTFPPLPGRPVRKVYLVIEGQRTLLKDEDLVLFVDSSCPMYDPVLLLPYSRIRNLRFPISNIIGSFESRATLIQSRGAMGILSNNSNDQLGPVPLPPNEKQIIQDQYKKYGLGRDQWQVIITEAALNWQPMTLSVRELMLHEENISCYKDVCDIYNYPFPLTAHSDQSTYNNVSTAERAFYQNEIIPASNDIIGPLNDALDTDRVVIAVDYSGVAALQQSEKEKGDALKAQNDAWKVMYDSGIATPNEWRAAVGMDTVNDPAFDKYKISQPNGQQSINGQGLTASQLQGLQ